MDKESEKKDPPKPRGRRALMLERQKQKGSVDNNKLFNKVTRRTRKYKLPFFDKEINSFLESRNDIKVSKREQRVFDVITLDNSLEVMVIQDPDPKATHASCAMAVNVGYFSDPDDVILCSSMI